MKIFKGLKITALPIKQNKCTLGKEKLVSMQDQLTWKFTKSSKDPWTFKKHKRCFDQIKIYSGKSKIWSFSSWKTSTLRHIRTVIKFPIFFADVDFCGNLMVEIGIGHVKDVPQLEIYIVAVLKGKQFWSHLIRGWQLRVCLHYDRFFGINDTNLEYSAGAAVYFHS